MSTTSPPTQLGQRLVLSLLLLLLLLPALQAKWPLVAVRRLGGYTDHVSSPHLSRKGLWTNTFQPALELYLTDRLGFRPWLVRLRNQLVYSSFDKVSASGVVLGKDQNLYQQGPIDVCMGRQYLGETELGFRARRLRRVQDSLQAHGTQFLFVLAPSKPRLVPQYLPDTSAMSHWSGVSNYTTVKEQFAKYGINTLDAVALMTRWRDAGSAYPLFPRTGTHWSGYAVARVADTLFRHIEHLTGHDLPDFASQGSPTIATRTTDLRYTDNDLGELINLVHDIEPYPMAYPNVVFRPGQDKQRLNALVIGDSFAQSFYGFYPFYDRLLTPESRYWSYNKYVYWPEKTPGETREVAQMKLGRQLRGRQLVLFISTESNLFDLGHGFINEAFNFFFPLTPKDEAQIASLESDIRHNPQWLASVTKRAHAQGIKLKSAIRQDAMYLQDKSR